MSAVDEAWAALEREATRLSSTHLRELFGHSGRVDAFSLEAGGILADFSKEKLDQTALRRLLELAEAVGLPDRIGALFSGAKVNASEGRAALHMALRGGVAPGTSVDGVEVLPLAEAELGRMLDFAERVRNGDLSASDGQPFSDVVNIGIGGSDLGAAMAVQALVPWHDGPRVHFLSNVDGTALADVIRGLDPKRTLIIIASKSFTTLETMTNARSARAWLQASLGPDLGSHIVAISTNHEAVSEFGISSKQIFGFWDWVGGRYSVWSSVGLPLAIAIGASGFRAFLDGAKEMDAHFKEASLANNLPVLLGLIGIWRRNAMGCPACAVIPYEERLARLSAFLQQLEMESNGKRVSASGETLERDSGGVIFGEPGTNAQHSFFQLLHQGTQIVPVDFLLGLDVPEGSEGHHPVLYASALAQASALAFGRTAEEVRGDLKDAGMTETEIASQLGHRVFPGDRPSTLLIYDRLDPRTLGALIALFEHRTFVQSVLWGINAFDQWGVERGKVLGGEILDRLDRGSLAQFDDSTAALIRRFRQRKGV